MKFDILRHDNSTKARTGIMHTDHGDIETPVFMPVGTAGTVKAVHQRELSGDLNAQYYSGEYISSISEARN